MLTADQDDRRLLQEPVPSIGERIVGLSGLVVAICFIAANILLLNRPAHSAPDDAVLAFYQQNASWILTTPSAGTWE